MWSKREVVEGPQVQGEDERIIYTIDISKWGSSPTALSFIIKDLAQDESVTDVTNALTAFVASSRERVSNVATIVTDEPHGLVEDDVVVVFNSPDATFNAESAAVTDVVDPYTFSYDNEGDDVDETEDVVTRVATPGTALITVITFILIQMPKILKPVKDHEYRVEIKFTANDQNLELPFTILGEM